MKHAGLETASVEPHEGVPALTLGSGEKEGAKFAAVSSSEGMVATNGHRPGAETTRALLEAIAGGRRGE